MPQQRYERVCQAIPHSPSMCLETQRRPLMHDVLTGSSQIAEQDEDEALSPVDSHLQHPHPIPSSPPPSFHSRASSPSAASRRLLSDDPLDNEADRTLADTFDNDSDNSDDEEDGMDDRQRLMRGQPEAQSDETTQNDNPRQGIQRRVTQLPVFQQPAPGARSSRIYGGGQNDGVWANLSAKPQRGDDVEEKPPVCIPHIVRTRTSC